MEISSYSISSFLTPAFVFILFNFAFTSANDVTLQGKLGGKPSFQIVPADRDIKLICDLNGAEVTDNTKPQWTFMRHGKVMVENVASSCERNRSSTLNDTSSLLSDCEVGFDRKRLQLILEIDDISDNEFGDYVCHTGDMRKTNSSFQLKELVQLTRKVKNDGKIQTSVTVTVGDALHIFCNATGLQPNKHEISWWRDGENITKQLSEGSGRFENFTRTDDLTFYGNALLEHRGNYTCQIVLKSTDSDDDEIRKYFPVAYSFFVRVKASNIRPANDYYREHDGGSLLVEFRCYIHDKEIGYRLDRQTHCHINHPSKWDVWKLPVYILIGECVLIGAFTVIINWREKRLEDDDVVYEDSEDEDDVPSSSSGNGTQNNNGKGK